MPTRQRTNCCWIALGVGIESMLLTKWTYWHPNICMMQPIVKQDSSPSLVKSSRFFYKTKEKY